MTSQSRLVRVCLFVTMSLLHGQALSRCCAKLLGPDCTLSKPRNLLVVAKFLVEKNVCACMCPCSSQKLRTRGSLGRLTGR